MSRLSSALRFLAVIVLFGGLLGVAVLGGVYWYLAPRLPSIDVLQDVHLQTPLKVYSRDGKLIAEFGEKRRKPLTLDQVPEVMIQAVLAAEDERFFEHPGVDWQGIMRAVVHLVRTGEKGPGGSTITMQVARNFFLGREKTYVRKLNEILLALEIERNLSKEKILELYLNKIFLGHRAYGIGAASQVYYGKPLGELAVEQIAMIAGLPKAPSSFNPIVNPERATARRNYVLGRMHELGYIDTPSYQAAMAKPVTARLHGLAVELDAPYVAEMVRAELEAREGETAYTAGYTIYTTLDSRLQAAANEALRKALVDYDRRHGWRGAEAHVALTAGADPETLLRGYARVGQLEPALVLAAGDESISVHVQGQPEPVQFTLESIKWARKHISENRRGNAPGKASEVVQPGDVVRVERQDQGWALAQIPAVEGALVALNPEDGAVLALVGGFDFYRSKFNRVTQAHRQPGSSFKPFVYSAALEKGFTPATFINDAPVVFDDPGLESAWRPENYSGKFFGPTRLREALYKSRNLVSIRLLRAVEIDYALKHLHRFGLPVDRLSPNLSLALGAGALSPLELARGYTVLANGGYLVTPWLVERMESPDGKLLRAARPLRVCRGCPGQVLAEPGDGTAAQWQAVPVAATLTAAAAPAPAGPAPDPAADPAGPGAPLTLDPRNAYIMNSMMRDVIRRGTGRKAMVLERGDLAGKTGTTNDQRDAWFSGFNPTLVATAWVGFDDHDPLGRRETGGAAALPMWIDFMRVALDGVPESFLPEPEGLITVRINPATGELAAAGDPDAIFETFRAEDAPALGGGGTAAAQAGGTGPGPAGGGVTEKLF